jgi:hypothetical protein
MLTQSIFDSDGTSPQSLFESTIGPGGSLIFLAIGAAPFKDPGTVRVLGVQGRLQVHLPHLILFRTFRAPTLSVMTIHRHMLHDVPVSA